MHYSKDRIVAGDAFGKIHLFDWNIGECFNVMKVAKSCVYAVEVLSSSYFTTLMLGLIQLMYQVCRKDTLVTASNQGISIFDFSIDTYNNQQLLQPQGLSNSGNNKCSIS